MSTRSIGNVVPMLNTALSMENPNYAENQSLIDELNSAVATGGEKQRLRILERVTDLFAAGSRGYSFDQIALFDDVLQALAAEIEVKARTRLAHRLAHISGGPPNLIRALAFDDEIAVAEPVLIHSQQLSDADLAENVLFLKRSMRPGFAGIENELLYNPKTTLIFGDAKDTLTKIVASVKTS